MEPTAQEQIQKRIAELPEDIRTAIASADLGKRIQEVGMKNQLHIDQMGELEDETLLVMLGFSSTETFGVRLSSELGLTREKGQILAKEVSDAVFLPIRESMKQFSAQSVAERTPIPPPPSAPAAVSINKVVAPLSSILPTKNSPPVVPIQATPPPVQTPKPQAQVPAVPELHSAELMLREKTLSTMPNTPAPIVPPIKSIPPPAPAPKIEATPPTPPKPDPYREPLTP